MDESNSRLTELLARVTRVLNAGAAGTSLEFGTSGSGGVSATISRLDFDHPTIRTLPRIERQIDRARQVLDASLFNPLDVMRLGAEFIAGAVEEGVSSLQDTPFDPVTMTLDLMDDMRVTLKPLVTDQVTVSRLDVKATRVKAIPLGQAYGFDLVLEMPKFEALLTGEQVLELVDARLPHRFRTRISDSGELIIDSLTARRHLGAVLDLSTQKSSIVVSMTRSIVFGHNFRLPKRFQRREVIELSGIVPDVTITSVELTTDGILITGKAPAWKRTVTSAVLDSLGRQLLPDER